MFSLDQYIIEFVRNNWISLSLFLGMLKIVAEMTDWVGDNKIYTLLAGTFRLSHKPPVGVPPPDERGEEL